jgi:hypothetical protein
MTTSQNGSGKKRINYANPGVPWGNAKKKKIKGIEKVIKQQELFIEQVQMTLKFLKMYEGNPRDFEIMLSTDIKKHYRMDECWDNAEWMWESIDEMTCDIVYKNKKFKFKANGIFQSLHFANSTPKNFRATLDKWFAEGDWGI